jgi:prephenate dehydrogenase
MPSSQDDQLFGSLVHELVSSSNDMADAIDKILESPSEIYHVTGPVFATIASLLKTDAQLISKMHVENEELADMLKKLHALEVKKE